MKVFKRPFRKRVTPRGRGALKPVGSRVRTTSGAMIFFRQNFPQRAHNIEPLIIETNISDCEWKRYWFYKLYFISSKSISFLSIFFYISAFPWKISAFCTSPHWQRSSIQKNYSSYIFVSCGQLTQFQFLLFRM